MSNSSLRSAVQLNEHEKMTLKITLLSFVTSARVFETLLMPTPHNSIGLHPTPCTWHGYCDLFGVQLISSLLVACQPIH